jgi:hypothetical protein
MDKIGETSKIMTSVIEDILTLYKMKENTKKDLKKATKPTICKARNMLRNIVAAILGENDNDVIDDFLLNGLYHRGPYKHYRQEHFNTDNETDNNNKKRKFDKMNQEGKENLFSEVLTPEVHNEIKKLTPTRSTFSPEIVEKTISWTQRAIQNKSDAVTEQNIRQTICQALDFYEQGKPRPDQVKEWVQNKDVEKKRPGPKVNLEFEQDVWGELMICKANAIVDGKETYKIVMDCVYNFTIIRLAAQLVQQMDKWKNDEQIQSLMFSDCWIKKFLDRNDLSRRRITSIRKMPEEASIKGSLNGNQHRLIQHQVGPEQILNVDETNFAYEIGPRRWWVRSKSMGSKSIRKETGS